MNTEIISVVLTGVGVLIGVWRIVSASNTNTNERIDKFSENMNNRFDTVLREMADLRERMARLEGALEGFLAGRRDRDAA